MVHPPTTRREFNARLLSLSIRNEELEERLREAEQSHRHDEIKKKTQFALLGDLLDAIHSMSNSNSSSGDDDNDSDTGGANTDTNIPEEMCILFTNNLQRISDLSEEVERLKLQLLQQIQVPRSFGNDSNSQNNPSQDNDDDDGFVEISLNDNRKENSFSSTSSTSSTSSSSILIEPDQQTIHLEEEIVRVNSKCSSLERSFKTLKRKNAEREIRGIKSLRRMKRQVDGLEDERRRRLDLQAAAEERAHQLEIEVDHLQQKTTRKGGVFLLQRNQQQQQPPNDEPSEIAFEENKRDGNQEERAEIETDPSPTTNGLDGCRELTMVRNQRWRDNQDSFPPLLVAVNEEREDSEGSEDEYCPSTELQFVDTLGEHFFETHLF